MLGRSQRPLRGAQEGTPGRMSLKVLHPPSQEEGVLSVSLHLLLSRFPSCCTREPVPATRKSRQSCRCDDHFAAIVYRTMTNLSPSTVPCDTRRTGQRKEAGGLQAGQEAQGQHKYQSRSTRPDLTSRDAGGGTCFPRVCQRQDPQFGSQVRVRGKGRTLREAQPPGGKVGHQG